MDIVKDIRASNIRDRIVNALYMYQTNYIKKKSWLSLGQRFLLAAMLDAFCGTEPLKKGWIKALNGKGVSLSHKYIYSLRMKESGWILMKNRKHDFPEDLKKIVLAIKKEEPVIFAVKV